MSPAKIKFFVKTNIYSKLITPKYKKPSKIGLEQATLTFAFTIDFNFLLRFPNFWRGEQIIGCGVWLRVELLLFFNFLTIIAIHAVPVDVNTSQFSFFWRKQNNLEDYSYQENHDVTMKSIRTIFYKILHQNILLEQCFL